MQNKHNKHNAVHFNPLQHYGEHMAHVQEGIYVVMDNVADDVVGAVMLHKAEAAAMRVYADGINSNKMIAQHVEDFDLIRLGYLGVDMRVKPDYAVIMTGKKWKAMLDAQNNSQQPEGK